MAVKEFKKDGRTWYRVQVSRIDEKGRRHQRKRYVKNLSEAYVTERDLQKELEEIISGKRAIT